MATGQSPSSTPNAAGGAGPQATRIAMRRRRTRRRRRLTRTAGVAVVLAVAGYGLASVASSPSSPTGTHAAAGSKTASTSTTITHLSKLVTPGDGDVFTVPAVATYLAGTTGNVTAAVYDAVTGVTSLYRPGVEEATASIIKVDILATLLDQAQADGTVLTDEQQDTATGMIEESDNDDATDLWDTVDGSIGINSFDAVAGLTQTDPNTEGYWGLTTTTALDQLQLLKKVAYPNTTLTDTSRHYELGLMTNVDPSQAWGISAGVPAGVTVAIKNGWLPLDAGGWQVNSIGYVDGEGRDYLIAVLTASTATEAAGIQDIEGLSTLVWQEMAPL